MANASILAAFERMWQHVVAALGNKADTSDVTDLQNQMDSKANVEHGHEISEITDLETELNSKANKEHKHESFDELPEGIAKLSDFNMIDTVSGNLVVSENCVPTTPRQLNLYGKSGQGENPTPQNPQPIESVGDDGDVVVSVLGKNLAKDYNNRSYTQNGITFTKNSDGSITADGTCTGGAATYLFMANGYSVGITSLKAGKYIISGCPDGGAETIYRIQMWHYDGVNSARDYGNGVEFECGDLDSSFSWNAAIRIEEGITVNNLTFYPMIRQASNTDPTYEPYTEQTLSLSTTGGLLGIPVESGGNYTDSDGQQYIADEIKLNADGTGKWVHRIGKLDGTKFNYASSEGRWRAEVTDVRKDAFTISTHLAVMCNIATFATTSAPGTCRPGTLTGANVQLIYAPETTDMSSLVYYYQCEPYETDLSAEEVQAFLNLRMNPTTTIMNDADCFMDVEYYVNNTENEVNQVIIEHITDHDDPHNVIPVIQEQINNLSVELTQAEYDALEAAGETDPETVYYITDADPEGGSGSGASSADKVSYDNTESGLEATDLQGAVDEVNSDVSKLNKNMNAHLNNDGGVITAESLEKAVAILCDRCTTPKDTYMGTFIYNNYPYIYKIVYISVGDWMGEISKHSWDGSNPYVFVRTAGADAVLKKLGSGEITIPKIYLYNYTHVFTAADKTEFFGGDGKANSEFKIYCEPHSSLKIGSTTASVTITCEKADGTTQNITVSSAETIDISAYKYVTFKPSLTTNIAGAYRNDTTTNASITLTDIVLS